MADSPTVTCASGAVSDSSEAAVCERGLEAGQLQALRSVLLGPLYHDLANLRARIAELEDPHRQAQRIAEHLPAALSLKPSTDPEIAAAFSPLIKAVMCGEANVNPPPSSNGGAASNCLWHYISTPARMARMVLNPRTRAGGGEIVALLLVHRSTNAVMEQFTRPFDDPSESRAIASMLAFLQSRLVDESFLAGYAKHESLQVENLAYGIHAGPLAILLSAIRGRHPAAALERCKVALGELHRIHAVALGAFDPADGASALLPGNLRGAGGA